MDQITDKFKKAGQNVRLMESEKQAMKDRILAMSVAEEIHPTKSWKNALLGLATNKFAYMTIVGAFVLGVFPITYAAQNSGPGDLLHSLELNVIEPVQDLVQFTPESQIAYSTRRLEERLDELQSSKESEVTGDQIEDLSQNLEDHVNETIDTIPGSSQQEAIDSIVEISALLNAHEDQLGEFKKSDQSIEQLIDQVDSQLATEVGDYVDQKNPDQLNAAVKQELVDVNLLIAGDTSNEAIQIAAKIKEAEKKASKGNYEEALQDIFDAKIQALTQDYNN